MIRRPPRSTLFPSTTLFRSLVQKNYNSNCNSASCGLAYTSNVVAGNTLAFALGWSGQNPPSTPTDTRGNTFTLGASNSVTAGGGTLSLVQRKYVPNCSSASCGAAFTSSVTVGDILVFGLGWPNNAPPSTPTDTLGDTYQLAVSNSVGAGSLALDGFTSNQASSTSVSSPLTTTNSNDVIYVSVTAKGGTGINTPTATGLTFTLRKSAGTTPKFATYYAIASSPLSAVSITATASGASYVIMNAFGVSGANTASPFDSNAAIPASNSGTGNSHSVTISTSNANDFLIGAVGIDDPTDACSTATALGGFTKITDKGNVLRWGASEYKIVSATQTSLSVTMSSNCSSSSTWVMIGDAVQAGSTYYSYIWYATAGSTGADTITASFSSSVAGSVSMYEIAGYTPLSPLTSTGSSATGSTSASVTSFTPSSNSFVVGNLETGASSSMYTTGSGYASVLTGAGGCDPTHSAQGCSEYQSGLGSATTVPFTLGASTPWVESAVSFAPNTYYSYIWYATSGSSGADTITASFSSSVTGSVSIYEINAASTTSPSTSTGSSSAGSTAVSVTSFTPAANSFVIGNAETASTTASTPVTTTYSITGTCSSVYGCGEHQAGVSSATTVPFTLGVAAPWVESAISFTPGTVVHYSYIWYATAVSSGADTITASFSSSVTGSVSVYEISGASTTSPSTSTGSSSTGSTAPAVTSFTPSANSFVIGNAETSSSTSSFTAGSGFTLSGTCSSVYGCGEYPTGVGSATTVPFTLGVSAPWAESAISFTPPTAVYYSYIWYATAV